MFYERALSVRQQLEKQIETLQIKIKELPSGKLICSRNGKYVKWYISDGKNLVYLPKQEWNLAQQLAIKKYYLLQLGSLSQEKKAVESYIKKHESHSFQKENNLFQIPGYRELILEQFNPDSKELSDWQKTPYEKNPSHPENLIYQTCTGDFVRSKSEVIITEALLKNKIPFRYECALQLKRKVIYPDFTIRHPETGEIL